MKDLTFSTLLATSVAASAYALDFEQINSLDGRHCNLTATGTSWDNDAPMGNLLIQHGEGQTTLWLSDAQDATVAVENEHNRIEISGGVVDGKFAAAFDIGSERQLAAFLTHAFDINSPSGRFYIDVGNSDKAIAKWLKCVESTR